MRNNKHAYEQKQLSAYQLPERVITIMMMLRIGKDVAG